MKTLGILAGLSSAAVAITVLGNCSSNANQLTSAASAGAGGNGTGGAGGGSVNPCPSGQESCSGACIDVNSDPKNCGACGIACASDEKCCAATCVATAGCDFAVTQVISNHGLQSGGDWLTLTGAGFADGMKVYLGDGRAPAQVLSATQAIIETPPDSPGKVDVKIAAGGKSATLRQSYQYLTGQLMLPWKSIKMDSQMEVVRGEDPGLAVMQDGRVLIAGGTTVPDHTEVALDTADIFIRDKEAVVPAANTMMGTARWQNSAVTLLDGKILVLGAACYDDLTNCGPGDPKAAHLFDPKTNTFTATGKLNVGRSYTRAVLLGDGRVLVISANAPSAEVYDPKTGSFTLIEHDVLHRFGALVRLRDGRALIAAGDGGVTNAEIFDPDTNAIAPTGNMKQGRSMLTAHTLPDGRVMFVGGASISAGGVNDPLTSIELYDPKTGTFATAPYKLTVGRCWHAGALVGDGTVLAMGGYSAPKTCDGSVGSVDQIDPVKGTVTPFAPLPDMKTSTEWTAVTLLDGSIVGVGGGACGTTKALPEIYFLAGQPGIQ